MHERYNIEERCRRILEDNGGLIADKARVILLEDPVLRDLRPPLEFISKNWRDLTPALMSLSCEAVGGQPDETDEVALAMCLIHLSFYVWDDIIDNARSKSFKPTLFGKFGGDTSLIVGGLASAKAFSILNEMDMEKGKRQIISELIWNLGTNMAHAETVTLRARNQKTLSSRKKFWKIKTQASDLETCLKIGATIGNGSESEINHLGKYGLCLGIISALRNDFRVSVNLTLELAQRMVTKELPYSLLWARNRSEKLQKQLDNLADQNSISQASIKEVVEELLATKVVNNVARNIRRQTKMAEEELACLRKNEATQTLRCLINAQPKLFSEDIPK